MILGHLNQVYCWYRQILDFGSLFRSYLIWSFLTTSKFRDSINFLLNYSQLLTDFEKLYFRNIFNLALNINSAIFRISILILQFDRTLRTPCISTEINKILNLFNSSNTRVSCTRYPNISLLATLSLSVGNKQIILGNFWEIFNSPETIKSSMFHAWPFAVYSLSEWSFFLHSSCHEYFFFKIERKFFNIFNI